MNVGFYALTEITLDTDYDLYYGPQKAASTVTDNGHFRLHVLPSNIVSILMVSRDFAGTTIEREAVYSVEEALADGFIMKIELDVNTESGLGTFKEAPGEIKSYKKKSKKPLDKNKAK